MTSNLPGTEKNSDGCGTAVVIILFIAAVIWGIAHNWDKINTPKPVPPPKKPITAVDAGKATGEVLGDFAQGTAKGLWKSFTKEKKD